MNLVAMIIGYYTISAYVLGTMGMILYWLLLERELRKRIGEPAHEKSATRKFVLGLGFCWWAGSPFTVPQWLIGRLIIEQLRKMRRGRV